jgi:hypothetical protein
LNTESFNKVNDIVAKSLKPVIQLQDIVATDSNKLLAVLNAFYAINIASGNMCFLMKYTFYTFIGVF